MICFAHKFQSHHSGCWGSWVGLFSETSLMQRAATELAAAAQQHQENMKISPPLQPVPKFSSDGCPALECPKLECRSAECVRWVEEKDNGGKRHRTKTKNNRNSSWTRRRKQQEHVLFRNEKKRNLVACRQVWFSSEILTWWNEYRRFAALPPISLKLALRMVLHVDLLQRYARRPDSSVGSPLWTFVGAPPPHPS